MTLEFKGIPHARLSMLKGSSVDSLILDADGLGVIQMPFSTAYSVRSNRYDVNATASGYIRSTTEVEVKNINYDEQCTAIEEKIAAMEIWEGTGNFQIAVHSITERSRCVSYSCVLDPANWDYVQLSVGVLNVGDDSIHVNPNHVTVQSSDGFTYTHETETYSLGNYLDAINLLPGGSTNGWLVFILPKTEHEFTLIYANSDGLVMKPIYVN